MSGEGAFEVEGLIVDALCNGTYRVQLPNGHLLLGYVTGRAKRTGLRVNAGDKVRLIVSPYDLSEGRIVFTAEQ